MPEIRIARWSTVGFPLDLERYKERFGNRFRRVGPYTQGVLLGAAAVLDQGCPDDMGVFLGSGLANLAALVPVISTIHDTKRPRCSPIAFASSVANVAAFHLAQAFDLHGHNVTLSQEELSFEAALLEAVLALNEGVCTWALVGGVDVPYPDAEAQRVRIGATDVEGELGSGVAFLLLGPEGPYVLESVEVGRLDPLGDLPPGAAVLRGWGCQQLDAPGEPYETRLHGIATGLRLAGTLEEGRLDRFRHLQFHRDGLWGRVDVARTVARTS